MINMIGYVDNIQQHKKLCMDLNELYEKKNRDYGNSFHQSFLDYGITMSCIRIGDKFQRFKNLSRKCDKEIAVTDESVRDTLIDLANYALMTVMEIDNLNECQKFVEPDKTYRRQLELEVDNGVLK